MSREELQRRAKTPHEFVEFYLKKQATLENVVESITGTNDIQTGYNVILERLNSASEEDKGYFELLKKALESQYTFLTKKTQHISVSITRSDSQKSLEQSQAGLSV